MKSIPLAIVLAIVLSVTRALAGGDPPPADVVIPGVPHVLQKPDFCGEACAEMYLRKLGHPVDQDLVFQATGVEPAEGRGAYTRDLDAALRSLGFSTGKVWTEIDPRKPDGIEAAWRALLADLRKGIPSIVCTHFDERSGTTEHFRLILGYRGAEDEVVYHDPAVEKGAYLHMPRARFLKLWPLAGGSEGRRLLVRLRLEAGKIDPPRPRPGISPAALAQHVMALRKKLPRGFYVVVESPFVVAGDEPLAEVRAHARNTVRWAVDHLRKEFFRADLDEVLDVWLFRDDRSYRRNVKDLFDEEPTTPYGYYSSEHRALIMNIATGGGTLVHEIVHPFIRADFPGCPAWLNEGLASLFEQSGERDGHMVGLTNWRLAGLQEAVRTGETSAFEELTALSDAAFYRDGRGVHYAQARYLCYYLQEKGLLVRFYRDFRDGRKEDPTGIGTLRKVLRTEDLRAFRKTWEGFVRKLTFP